MRKPINWIAVAFCAVGALLILSDIPAVMEMGRFEDLALRSQGAIRGGLDPHVFTLLNIWRETSAAIVRGGQLIGVGVVIELVDRIRWSVEARHPNSLT